MASHRPTMRDVAALAGVSTKTVSRVVNAEPLVSPSVHARVTTAIEQLRYQHDLRAGSLRRSGNRSETIGLVVSSVAHPFTAAVHRAVEKTAAERGVVVLALSNDDTPERELPAVEALLRRRVDGLILTPVRGDQSYLVDEQRFGTPIVVIDRPAAGLEIDCVVSDHVGGAAVAAAHLLERGHRRIAYLGNRDTIFSAAQRRHGFLEELRRRGVPSEGCRMITGLATEEEAARAATELLTGDEPPTAIFSAQSIVSVGVIRALRALGLQQSVAFAGFDDLPLAELLDPAITVIAQDPDAIGERAAARLFDRLGGDRSAPQTYVIPTRLIERGSGEIGARG